MSKVNFPHDYLDQGDVSYIAKFFPDDADNSVGWGRQNELHEELRTSSMAGHEQCRLAASAVVYLVVKRGLKLRDVHVSLRGAAGIALCQKLEAWKQAKDSHPAGRLAAVS